MRLIYLDYNATTPVAPEAQEAILPFLSEYYGNPSSQYVLGRAAFEVLEESRFHLANLLRCERSEIIFTSGGTESCNLALMGTAFCVAPRGSGHLVVSSIEHPAVLQTAKFLESMGYGLSIVTPNRQGIIDPESVMEAIQENTFLVSITLAHHETGILQPVSQIAERCRLAGVLVHADACQAVGTIPVHVARLNVDLLSMSGHKMYASKGIGALFVRHGAPILPILHGEENECGLRSGMENVPGIVAFGKMANVAEKYMQQSMERMTHFRNQIETILTKTVPGLIVNGKDTERLPNTSLLTFPRVFADQMRQRLPELCFSTSSSPLGRNDKTSPALSALGRSAAQIQGTIRLSVGRFNSEEQIVRASEMLASAWENLQTT
ncbi:MAG: cysteine desulfurase [Planctomycetaceae bacterium]|jgi:cysteine desulfurase|nr:cysteine desulfurase [Planctomycetaceae bacterium]